MRVKLLTAADRAALLKNAAAAQQFTSEVVAALAAPVKLFDPCGRWTYYAFEAQERDGDVILFGYCVSPLGADCDEWGYASLNEIAATRNRLRLPMERDRFFAGVTRAQIAAGERP